MHRGINEHCYIQRCDVVWSGGNLLTFRRYILRPYLGYVSGLRYVGKRKERERNYDMIYLLTAVGLSPCGTTHLYTNNTQNNTNNNRTTQITNNVEECGACPVFASFILAFALQLRKKHGKSLVRVRKTLVRLIKASVSVQYTYYQNTHTLQNPHKHTH